MMILGISGSLKAASSNSAILRLAKGILPAPHDLIVYEGLGALPHFQPELDDEKAPDAVRRFRVLLKSADAVLISTPEYAFGMPGALKNALDWTVSSGEFLNKPTAALSASPGPDGGSHAHASLLLVLSALSARVVPSASFSIPMVYKRISKTGEVLDASLLPTLGKVLADLIAAAEADRAIN